MIDSAICAVNGPMVRATIDRRMAMETIRHVGQTV
jgi:hypothetical protein